jgi:hypothetical protein
MLQPDWSHLINLPVWDYGMIEKRTREVVDVGHETGARPTAADYFAHTFAGVITSNEATPKISGMWMAVLIDLTK